MGIIGNGLTIKGLHTVVLAPLLPTSGSNLLLESGFNLLQENSSTLLLET